MSKILWLSWKDYKNPDAGGAEVVGNEIRKRLVSEGNEVVHLTRSFPGSLDEELISGVRTVRLKSPKIFIALASLIFYMRKLQGRFDLIVEEVNTSPYFANYYKKHEKVVLLYHQLTGVVWDYEFPFPLNLLGKHLLEPMALWINRTVKKIFVISQSTKNDLIKHGFISNEINILPMATNLIGLNNKVNAKKNDLFTVTYFGSLRKMKRPEEIIKGFAHTLRGVNAKLVISGSTTKKRELELQQLIETLGIKPQTIWTGRISDEQKRKLFEMSHVLCMTSIKEGWGMVAMEAGLFETPALVYDVDGLRDAIINKRTGILVTNNNYQQLGEAMKFLYNNPELTKKMGKTAREYNEQFSFEKTYAEFKKVLTN